MPAWKPLKRRELIAALRRVGFRGPYSGGRHEFMQKGSLVLTIILRQAGIPRSDWEKL